MTNWLNFAISWLPVWWITLMLLFAAIVDALLITSPKYLFAAGWRYAWSRLLILFLVVVPLLVMIIYYEGTVYDTTGTKYFHGFSLWAIAFFVLYIIRLIMVRRREGRSIYVVTRAERDLAKREAKLLKHADIGKAERTQSWKSVLADELLIPAVIDKVKQNPQTAAAQESDIMIRSLFCVEARFIEAEEAMFVCTLRLKLPDTKTPKLYLTQIHAEEKSGRVVIKKIEFIKRYDIDI